MCHLVKILSDRSVTCWKIVKKSRLQEHLVQAPENRVSQEFLQAFSCIFVDDLVEQVSGHSVGPLARILLPEHRVDNKSDVLFQDLLINWQRIIIILILIYKGWEEFIEASLITTMFLVRSEPIEARYWVEHLSEAALESSHDCLHHHVFPNVCSSWTSTNSGILRHSFSSNFRSIISHMISNLFIYFLFFALFPAFTRFVLSFHRVRTSLIVLVFDQTFVITITTMTET